MTIMYQAQHRHACYCSRPTKWLQTKYIVWGLTALTSVIGLCYYELVTQTRWTKVFSLNDQNSGSFRAKTSGSGGCGDDDGTWWEAMIVWLWEELQRLQCSSSWLCRQIEVAEASANQEVRAIKWSRGHIFAVAGGQTSMLWDPKFISQHRATQQLISSRCEWLSINVNVRLWSQACLRCQQLASALTLAASSLEGGPCNVVVPTERILPEDDNASSMKESRLFLFASD